jgi:hypothetical protein
MATKKKADKKTKSKQATSNDLDAICEVFRTMDGRDFIALQPSSERSTQSAGHEDAAEVAHERKMKKPSYVFWHAQSHEDAFDARGMLVKDLYLHWGGDHAKVRRKLQCIRAPYALESSDDDSAFIIHPPLAALAAVDDEAAVRGRLKQCKDESYSEATESWLHDVIARSAPSCTLQALACLLELASKQSKSKSKRTRLIRAAEIERVANDWEALALAAENQRKAAAAALEVLDGGDAEQKELVLAQCVRHSNDAFRYAAVDDMARKPSRSAPQALRRLVADPTVGNWALLTLIRAEAALTQKSEMAVGLSLAEDATILEHHRDYALYTAAKNVDGAKGDGTLGCLLVAEDERHSRSLRKRALASAVDLLSSALEYSNAQAKELLAPQLKQAKHIHALGLELPAEQKKQLEAWA